MEKTSINGYASVFVETAQTAYVINFLRHARLKNIQITKQGVSFYIPLRKKVLLQKLALKGFRVHILNETTSTSIWKKWIFRFGVILGLVCSFGIVFGLTAHTWRVDIVCEETLTEQQTQQLQQVLVSYGICIGAKQNTQTLQQAERAVVAGVHGISYCRILYEGVIAQVKLVLATNPQAQTGKDIVASQTGLILEMCVTSGTSLVKTGDVVQKGQVLVQGDKQTGKNAEATIRALVQLTGNVTYDENSVRYVRTGNVAEYIVYSIGKYTLHSPKINHTFTLTEKVEKQSYIFPNLLAPIVKTSILYYEIKEEKVAPLKKVLPVLQQQAYEKALQTLPYGVQISQVSYYTQQKEGLSVVVAVLHTQQNIAQYQEE